MCKENLVVPGLSLSYLHYLPSLHTFVAMLIQGAICGCEIERQKHGCPVIMAIGTWIVINSDVINWALILCSLKVQTVWPDRRARSTVGRSLGDRKMLRS